MKNKQLSLKESNRMEFTESMKWIKKQTKNITDSDGFQTEYTWYYSPTEGTHIMIFGDSDLYTPNNTEPDWEGETDKEAKEWFDNYKGFEDESVYSVESLKEDWRDQMDDKDGHAQAYKSKAFAVNKAFADTIVNAMEEYIKEAQRGWITTEQVTKYGKMLGLDSIPYAKLSDIWQDIDNVASYYAFGTKDFNKSQKLLDASSAFLEIVNHYAREYRKNNPGRGKQAAMDAIDDIINNAANVTTDSEGVEYLSGTALRQIKEIAKKAGLTQSELEKHNKNFFGSMGYSIFESSKTTDIGKTYADIKIEKDFKAIGADNIKECRNRFESLLGKENNFIAYDEVMSGLIDNVSDEEIDRQIKNFNRYARLLKVTPENMIIYADAEMEQYPEEIALKVKQLNSDAILYKIPGTEIFFIEEMFPNAYSWLYFKTKKEAEVYFETAENN